MNSSHPINCPTEYHGLCKALWVPGDSRVSGFWLETASLRRGRCQNREGLTINSGAWHKLESNEHWASGSSGTAAQKCQVAARGRQSSKSQTPSKASLTTDTASQDGKSRQSLQSFNGAPTNPPQKGSAGSGQTKQGHRRQLVPLDADPGLTVSVGKTS